MLTAIRALAATFGLLAPLAAQPLVSILLPERTRLLQDQRFDMVVEVRGLSAITAFRVTANGQDLSRLFTQSAADLDCNATTDIVLRAEMAAFSAAGWVRVEAAVEAGGQTYRDVKDVLVQAFKLPAKPRNVILFLGDAMANDYRDAARIVARSVETVPNVPGLREGFFDRLLEMDRMPVSGMVMNYGSDVLVPDSAATATHWSTGNKGSGRAVSALGDGTDCVDTTARSIATALDNPRVETLWEYMRRKYNYRTGIVTTSFLTDATPAAHGSHTGNRDTHFEIARQYFENPFLGGKPVFDVLLGGGYESFDPTVRADRRDLAGEFQAAGYRLLTTATELREAGASDGKLLGLFRKPNSVAVHSSGIRPSANGTMEPAYDKLRLTRPGSEPLPNFGKWTDQPFLDLMTQKAIEALGGPGGNQPFMLLVEAGLIDKQSHSNHAAGAIWDTIELDKAVGVAREWARTRRPQDTLMLVTADHGQSMTVIGVTQISDADLYDRTATGAFTLNPGVGEQKFSAYKDANTNVRAPLNFGTSGKVGPPAWRDGKIVDTDAYPDYQDADGDGYPENREVNGKGRTRLAVGFRTGSHTGASLPLTAEGPGAFLFTGYMDQTDIFFKMAAAMTGETAEADALLEMLNSGKYPRTIGK